MTARNTRARPVPERTLARHRACVRSDARRPNPASSEDGTSSHGSVASRPIEWQRETQGPGRPPFLRLRARSRYATCIMMSAGLRVRGDAQMLAISDAFWKSVSTCRDLVTVRSEPGHWHIRWPARAGDSEKTGATRHGNQSRRRVAGTSGESDPGPASAAGAVPASAAAYRTTVTPATSDPGPS